MEDTMVRLTYALMIIIVYVFLLGAIPYVFIATLHDEYKKFNDKGDFKLPYSTIKKMLKMYIDDDDILKEVSWKKLRVSFKEKEYVIGVNNFWDYIRYVHFIRFSSLFVNKRKEERDAEEQMEREKEQKKEMLKKVNEYKKMNEFLKDVVEENRGYPENYDFSFLEGSGKNKEDKRSDVNVY